MGAGRISVPWPLAVAGLAAATAVAFWPSYAALAPLVGSDSPDAVLAVLPLAALAVIAVELRGAQRRGDELAVNFALSLPLVALLATLLVVLPGRLSYAYWLYRIDLLAVPVFAAVAILLLFGFPALYATRRGLLLLVLAWPPLVDAVVRATATPLARLQTAAVGLLVLPLKVTRDGSTFVLAGGSRLTVSTACAGLSAVFTAAAVGGAVALTVGGPRRRRLAWVGLAVALAALGNAVRLAIVVGAGAVAGTGSAFSLLHAGAGVVVFALSFLLALSLLPRFGLVLARRGVREPAPLPLPRRSAVTIAALLGALAVVALATTAGAAVPGMYYGAPRLAAGQLLAPPRGWRVAAADEDADLARSFGSGSRAQIVHLVGPGGAGVAAQVIVTRSYRAAAAYGVLDCFSFHGYRIRSSRYVRLGRDGTAALVALRLGGSDVSSASWLQPVVVAGRRSWRRVVLFAYAAPTSVAQRLVGGTSVGLWLLNHLSPYGAAAPPPQFRESERELLAVAAATARGATR